MGTYIILNKNGAALPIEPEVLASRLLVNWPSAVIDTITGRDNINVLQWSIERVDFAIEGQLRKDKSAISLNGDMLSSASFVIWCHNLLLVPELIVYDETFDNNLQVTGETTLIDIVNKFSE
jgi:hypothetical protein